MRRGPACLAVLLWAAAAAFGQDAGLEAWFRDDPRAKAYSDSRRDIAGVFADAEAADVPAWVLLDKLREGASKGVSPDRLTAGLRAEYSRLVTSKAILARTGVAIPEPGEYEDALRDMSIWMLAGLGAETMEALFSSVRGGPRTPGDVLAACAALIQMKSSSRLEEKDLLRLGRALLSSRLPSSSFASVPAFFVKARASGLRESEILDSIVVKALESGGGFVRMDELLRSMQKGRQGP
jgi:hypothetical protein